MSLRPRCEIVDVRGSVHHHTAAALKNSEKRKSCKSMSVYHNGISNSTFAEVRTVVKATCPSSGTPFSTGLHKLAQYFQREAVDACFTESISSFTLSFDLVVCVSFPATDVSVHPGKHLKSSSHLSISGDLLNLSFEIKDDRFFVFFTFHLLGFQFKLQRSSWRVLKSLFQ